jgi:hypothetical protein
MRACVQSSNGFIQRLDLNVRDPGLPRLLDGLAGACGAVFAIHSFGPVAWWPAVICLPPGVAIWLRGLRAARQAGPQRLILTADGRWQIARIGSRPTPAVLRAGWLAGRYCGLLLVGGDGRNWRVYFSARELGPDRWRRLRVRLSLPQPPALT